MVGVRELLELLLLVQLLEQAAVHLVEVVRGVAVGAVAAGVEEPEQLLRRGGWAVVIVIVGLAAAGAIAQDRLAVRVVPRTLLRVAQDRIGCVHLLELLSGLVGIVRVLVGMPAQRRLAVGLLDLVAARGAGAAQDLVVARAHLDNKRVVYETPTDLLGTRGAE